MVFSSGDFLLTAKVSWKPLRSLPLVTCTLVSESITDCGAGMGTAGPINSVRWIPLCTGRCSCGCVLRSAHRRRRHAFGQRDAQTAPDFLGELVRPHGTIGVADAPELLRVVEIARRDVVETIALRDHVLLQQRETFRRRHEAAPEIDDL